jgi:hypothetical protein
MQDLNSLLPVDSTWMLIYASKISMWHAQKLLMLAPSWSLIRAARCDQVDMLMTSVSQALSLAVVT